MWQPMVSAPRDGTRFLVACADHRVRILRWNTSLGAGWLDDEGSAQHDFWNYVDSPDCPDYVEWQPLPDPSN